MTEQAGKSNRKLPERADALRVPLDFQDAIRGALETKPPPSKPPAPEAQEGARLVRVRVIKPERD